MADMRERYVAKAATNSRLEILSYLHDQKTGLVVALELMALQPNEVSRAHMQQADIIRHELISMLAESEMFIGTPEICTILNGASASYPTAEVFLTDILVPSGMLYFTEPIDDPDVLDGATPMRAFSWSLTPIEHETKDAFGFPKMVKTGEYMLTVIGYSDAEMIELPNGRDGSSMPSVYPVVSVRWEVGSPDGGLMSAHVEDENLGRFMREPYVKILMAFWAIMRQRLTEAETVTKVSPKEFKRTRQRMPKTKINDGVQVIRMRPRTHTTYTGEHGFNRPGWQSKWVVRSHWRRAKDRKPILILSYIKGPEHLELTGQERAYLPPEPLED